MKSSEFRSNGSDCNSSALVGPQARVVFRELLMQDEVFEKCENPVRRVLVGGHAPGDRVLRQDALTQGRSRTDRRRSWRQGRARAEASTGSPGGASRRCRHRAREPPCNNSSGSPRNRGLSWRIEVRPSFSACCIVPSLLASSTKRTSSTTARSSSPTVRFRVSAALKAGSTTVICFPLSTLRV